MFQTLKPSSARSIDIMNTPEELMPILEEADIKTLLMVLVSFTKDESLLREARPYVTGAWDFMHQLPDALQERIRLGVASILRESGHRHPQTAVSADLLQLMMETCVGQTVPSEYVPLLQERFAFEGSDAKNQPPRAFAPRKNPIDFRVIVVGAGMSGICASVQLAQAGIEHLVIEKSRDIGGTWLDNHYPGAGVDTPNHVYCYSFEPNYEWPEYFSKRDQLLGYFKRTAQKYRVYERTRFSTTVVSATYDENCHRWTVETLTSDGTYEVLEANVVIFAVGLLNRPSIPALPGLDTFKGPILHTARWDHSVDIAGKDVAMIGTGASGMQVGPTIAPNVSRLTIFQRSPHWVASNPNYHRKVADGKKWALKNIPLYAEWYRFQLFWASSDSIHPSLFLDPDWPTPQSSLNAANEKQRRDLTKSVRDQIGDDEELLSKVIPTYPPYGKRMLRDNNWYGTLLRQNVELVVDPIESIGERSVRAGAHEYPADVLVLATGFSVGRVLGPISVKGRDNVEISDIWGEDDPRAYLGITVPQFPNMFILYGPNTNLAHGGTAVFHTECQVGYAMQCIGMLIDSDFMELECRQSVHDSYNERVDAAHSKMVWAHSGVTSWYKNKSGRVFATSPWRLIDYWTFTKTLNPADYEWK
jgi:4-hydroxyacetophenone monooxygenase